MGSLAFPTAGPEAELKAVEAGKYDASDALPLLSLGAGKLQQDTDAAAPEDGEASGPPVRMFLLGGVAGLALLALAFAARDLPAAEPGGVALPTEAQLRLMDAGLSQAVFYDVNPFADRHVEHNCAEISSPDCLPASLFNPKELSTEQWLSAAKALGVEEVCVTAHHESGFALWDTSYNLGYTVMASPYGRDILRDFVTSCKKHGVRVCYYWGPNANGWLYKRATPEEFLELQHAQLRELLVDYGPVSRLWWDHYPPDGSGGCLPGLHAPCPRGSFPAAWKSFREQVRELSPETLICPGPDCLARLDHPRLRTSQYPVWLTCKKNEHGVCESNRGVKGGDLFMPHETVMSPLVAGWFQHGLGGRGELALSPGDYWADFLDTVGMGVASTVNAPPDISGLVPPKVLSAMEAMGRLKRPLYEPQAVSDNVVAACTDATAELKITQSYNAVVSREDLRHGQRIVAYTIEAMDPGGHWRAVAQPCRPGDGAVVGCLHGESVGAMVVDLLGTQVAPARLRWRCLEALQDPVHLRSFGATLVQEPPSAVKGPGN